MNAGQLHNDFSHVQLHVVANINSLTFLIQFWVHTLCFKKPDPSY